MYGRITGADGRSSKVYLGTVDSRKEATALEEDHRVKQRMRASGELAAEHDTKRTLQEAAESWLRWLAESHSRSHRAYSEFMKYQILPHLGAASIATLTNKHVARWRDDVANLHRGLFVGGTRSVAAQPGVGRHPNQHRVALQNRPLTAVEGQQERLGQRARQQQRIDLSDFHVRTITP